MKDSVLPLADGRALAYTDLGDPDGSPVLYFHGAPTSRLDLVGFDSAFASVGVRVISPDRPGYGGSSPQPGRRMEDWPSDVVELVEHLGIGRFAAMGYSGGGPYAAVCAAELADRLTAAATVAGVTDRNWSDAWDGTADVDVTAMRLGDETAATAWYVECWGPDGSGFFEGTGGLAPADEAVLADPEFGSGLVTSTVEAFRPGLAGYAQDMTVGGRGWPFDPAAILVPFTVLHGAADTVVPLVHGRHTAEIIPTASLTTLDDHGHLSILSEIPGLALRLTQAAR